MRHLVKFLAAVLCVCFALNCCSQSASVPNLEKLNVVLIVVDTLGARHLGIYGNTRVKTPFIDELGREGVLFEHAYSTAPWTKPSLASLFTSLMPGTHGVQTTKAFLSEKIPTMAEYFAQKGFSAHGIISHTLITAKHGYGKGFESYRLVPFKGNVHHAITSAQVSQMALEFLDKQRTAGKPFFLFLHYFDPHYNYQHHAQFDQTSAYRGALTPGMDIRELRKRISNLKSEDVDFLNGLYHEEIAFTDNQIGVVMQKLRELQIDDKTLVVLTADHGEEFLEHGWIGHTRTLYEELTHVPLIFSLPKGLKALRVTEPVSLLDVLPTVDALSSQPAQHKDWQGVSLLPLLNGKTMERGEVFTEVQQNSSFIHADMCSLSLDMKKIIFDRASGKIELYDLEKDPAEKTNLSEKNVDLRETLLGKLKQQFGPLSPTTPKDAEEIEQSQEELEQLKTLGYL